jgi:hypothetical protein
MPQQVHALDAVRPRRHPRDQAPDLQLRVDPARAAGPDMLSDQAGQPGPLGQGHHRHQPGPRHEVRVIEGCMRPGQAMQQLHLQGVLSNRMLEALDTPIFPVQRAPFTLTRSETALLDRWIEAKPIRARAYLLTDHVVTETFARYANRRPGLDAESRRAILAGNDLHDSVAGNPAGDIRVAQVSHPAGDYSGQARPDEALWLALCLAPDEGIDVAGLLSLTGMSRPTLYRRLAEHVEAGRAVQVSRGRWRAVTTEKLPR